MLPKTGKNRVVVEHVRPQVDGGRYPAKRTVGESVDVTAHIFGDGHDVIRTHLKYKKKGSRIWSKTEMNLLMNDEWSGSFKVDQEGYYQFTLIAWIDYFATWFEGLRKKIEDGQQVDLELLEGASFLEGLKTTYKKEDPTHIDHLISVFKDSKMYTEALEEVMSDDFEALVLRCPVITNETGYGILDVIVESKKSLFSTWYEIFPRSASQESKKHGTFKDVEALLPHINDMGFDVLYLPPIHPIGKLHRKGKNNNVKAKAGEPGSPWAIGSDEGGHKDILSELGTLADYKSLIRNAKKLGIDIALDLAYQCAPDHPYVKQHPDWFRWRPDGTVKYAENPPKKYQDILPINFEGDKWEDLWKELKSVIDFWIKQGVKIFRVDNPHTKPIPFWEWALGEVKKEHPEVIFLAEAFTRPKIMASLAKSGFQQSYTYFTWRVSKWELIEYMTELVNTESRDYFRPNFWPNTPDILPYHLQNASENQFIIRYILAATLSSSYGIYGPLYEFYYNTAAGVREEYYNSEKYEIQKHNWKKITRLKEIIAIINQARKDNEALQSTWNLSFCEIDNDQILTYIKATEDLSSVILVAVNLDPDNTQSGYAQIPLDRLGLRDIEINIKLEDLITGDKFTWTNEWNFIQIDPNKIPFQAYKVELKESFI
jgi:starch synthase (maltosyl-transferring)